MLAKTFFFCLKIDTSANILSSEGQHAQPKNVEVGVELPAGDNQHKEMEIVEDLETSPSYHHYGGYGYGGYGHGYGHHSYGHSYGYGHGYGHHYGGYHHHGYGGYHGGYGHHGGYGYGGYY